MILKTRVELHHGIAGSEGLGDAGWLWLDGVQQAQSFGYVPPPDDAPGNVISVTRAQLIAWVGRAWGTERSFAREMWPEFPDAEAQRTVTCIRLELAGGGYALALVCGDTYLLSDAGHTVDRLR